MSEPLLWTIIAACSIAAVIAAVIRKINGDDNEPWPHQSPEDFHRWM